MSILSLIKTRKLINYRSIISVGVIKRIQAVMWSCLGHFIAAIHSGAEIWRDYMTSATGKVVPEMHGLFRPELNWKTDGRYCLHLIKTMRMCREMLRKESIQLAEFDNNNQRRSKDAQADERTSVHICQKCWPIHKEALIRTKLISVQPSSAPADPRIEGSRTRITKSQGM
ncbi:uncharacterized protein PADG_02960 [Paracoccidioides brasiliensis Pb18]|uniref:Uncharacterized protein n=1 Tax=Paracoccidioides brasiliensis (strain Pb18) TaxID=502780 RepID=C1G705_PARBD|nr:uncharacterized protein PADG_02960 [Paracoccidioides brasiliensis Pb18]EEH46862.2 hypothetical protein PADG_02960 [Paracoccidioides brasiliensis Pb18]ODH48838.1 hypothetical protein GX48_05062 [Paracoccidioides brasiliensis]